MPDSVAQRVRSLRERNGSGPDDWAPATPDPRHLSSRPRAPTGYGHLFRYGRISGMGIVAGLDSSPDFTRIVVCDSDTGAVLRQGYAPHPVESPEGGGRPADVDPQAWLLSLGEAAGGGLLEGVQAIGVSAQANSVVPLDAQGNTVRPAMVGGDKRSQVAAADLIDALGGREAWAQAVGCVPQAPSR